MFLLYGEIIYDSIKKPKKRTKKTLLWYVNAYTVSHTVFRLAQ